MGQGYKSRLIDINVTLMLIIYVLISDKLESVVVTQPPLHMLRERDETRNSMPRRWNWSTSVTRGREDSNFGGSPALTTQTGPEAAATTMVKEEALPYLLDWPFGS